MRIPRKKKKQIPKGYYCYTRISEMIYNKGELPYFKIKKCPFDSYIKYKDIQLKDRPNWMDDEFIEEFKDKEISWCRLVKGEIEDQCKSCGSRY